MSYNFEYMSPLWNVLPGDIANMLVGRQEYLSQILRAFNNGAKVVQVIGPGGIGKTTLLALYARHVDKLYEGRVYGSYASAVESPNELVTRVLPGIPQENTLLVIDEVDRLSNNDLSELEHVIKQSSNIHILTASRSPLSGLSKLSSIYLEGFTKEEFREAMTLRSAIANNIIDYPEINRLFALSGGNPLLAKFAADALSRGLVKTWSELFAHLRSYSTPGLIDINGRPLSDDSPELKQVIIDVEFTNDRILGFLKKEPQILWQLSPRKFEEIVAELLISKGYDIELTPASGDGGIDIYAAKKDDLGKFLYLVECKKYVPPSKVGVEVVRSLHGVVQSKKATAGAIVTTSYFTKGAAEFQREIPHQMGLHDYFVLQHWINDFPIARH